MRRKLSFIFIISAFLASAVLASATAQVAEASTRNYSFQCRPPNFGQSQCGDRPYIMSPGKYVQVYQYGSSEGGANFKLYNSNNSTYLAEVHVSPNELKTVWTNTTGQTVNVYFEADADPPFQITLRGEYRFGEF